MSTLRVRFKLNPGRHGVLLGKLSKQAGNIELFLRSLAGDLGKDSSPNMWLATNFANGSVHNDVEYRAVTEAEVASQFNDGVSALAKYKSGTSVSPPEYISAATLDYFANLRQSLDADEKIGIAVYDLETGRRKPFRYVDKVQLEEIGNSIEAEMHYVGAVMGRTHEWNKGADKPYLIIREINSGELIKCCYNDDDYSSVAKLFQQKTAVAIIQGAVTFNRVTSKTEVTMATDFEIAPDLTDQEFDAFFGCALGITGSLTAAEFISKGRKDD